MAVLPQVEKNTKLIQKTAAKSSLLSFLQPHKLIYLDRGNQVFYAKSSDANATFYDIFLLKKDPIKGTNNIIIAPVAHINLNDTNKQSLLLENGNYYIFDIKTKEITTGKFKNAVQFISDTVQYNSNNSIESISTLDLLRNNTLRNQAEFQWRMSFPLIIIISSLLALFISHIKPRQGRYIRLVPGVLVFISYFNLISLAKSWVENAVIPSWIGIWLIHLLFLVIALYLFKHKQGPLLSSRHE